jgi:uncharacterized protein YndB with AHSA1/START domain
MTEDSLVTITAEPRGREVIITRIFEAPRDLVFKACTDPNLIPQWWGPKEYTTAVDEMDVRFGGIWRYVQRGPEGNEFAFKGVYHTVTPPERLAYTFEFEGMPAHVMLETAMFEEQSGKTTMTVIDVFQTVEDRDGALDSGMKEGATESMDRFAQLLQKLKGD